MLANTVNLLDLLDLLDPLQPHVFRLVDVLALYPIDCYLYLHSLTFFDIQPIFLVYRVFLCFLFLYILE